MPTITVDASSDAPSRYVSDAFQACERALRAIRPRDASITLTFTQTGPLKSWENVITITSDDFRQPLKLKLIPRQAYQMARIITNAIRDEIAARAASS
jgi:hypothetical protein